MIEHGPVPDIEGTNEIENEVSNLNLSHSPDVSCVKENDQITNDHPATEVIQPYTKSKINSDFIPATVLFDKNGELPMLISPIFQKIGIAAVIGSSDTGKSSFLRQLAYDVATGSPTFLGFKINATHQRAIYVSTEDDEEAISTLLRKQFGKPEDSTKTDRLKYIFQTEDLLNKLDKEMSMNPVDLVVIDAFSDLYSGDMNSSNMVRTYMNKYSNLAKKHRCLIIFLHHTGKRVEFSVPGKDNALGSQGFESKVRLLIELRRDPNHAAIRHLCIVKGNYLQDSFKTHSIALLFTESMLFENLNASVPFEALVKTKPGSANMENAKEKAIALKAEGQSIRKIAETLKEEGIDVGKTTVGEWTKPK